MDSLLEKARAISVRVSTKVGELHQPGLQLSVGPSSSPPALPTQVLLTTHESFRGSEYTADLSRPPVGLGCDPVMSRVGSALGNAAAESFFSTLEFERLRKDRFAISRPRRGR